MKRTLVALSIVLAIVLSCTVVVALRQDIVIAEVTIEVSAKAIESAVVNLIPTAKESPPYIVGTIAAFADADKDICVDKSLDTELVYDTTALPRNGKEVMVVIPTSKQGFITQNLFDKGSEYVVDKSPPATMIFGLEINEDYNGVCFGQGEFASTYRIETTDLRQDYVVDYVVHDTRISHKGIEVSQMRENVVTAGLIDQSIPGVDLVQKRMDKVELTLTAKASRWLFGNDPSPNSADISGKQKTSAARGYLYMISDQGLKLDATVVDAQAFV